MACRLPHKADGVFQGTFKRIHENSGASPPSVLKYVVGEVEEGEAMVGVSCPCAYIGCQQKIDKARRKGELKQRVLAQNKIRPMSYHCASFQAIWSPRSVRKLDDGLSIAIVSQCYLGKVSGD